MRTEKHVGTEAIVQPG